MSRSSLGVVLVALGTPRARRDLRLCGFSPTASLDEVCRTLAATGMYSAETLRIDALRALGRVVERRFKSAEGATRHLAKMHRRLGVWAAASCAREALCLVPKQESRPRIAVETAEGWVRGEATREQAEKAASAAYAAAANSAANAAYSAYDAARAAADAADAADAAAWCAAAAAAAAANSAAADAWYAARDTELRRLVSVICERLVLFPALAGDPAEDLWPMPSRER